MVVDPAGRGRHPRRAWSPTTTSRGARSASGCTPTITRAPARVDEHGALAAHRLRHQQLLPGRRRARARARSGGTARTPRRRSSAPARSASATPVAGDRGRVRRRGEHLAVPAGREHDRARVQHARPALTRSSSTASARRPRPAVGRRTASRASVPGRAPRRRGRAARRPGCAAPRRPMASPPAWTMRSWLCPPSRVQRERAARVGVERGAERRMQVADRVGPSARRACATTSSSHSPAPAASVSRDVVLDAVARRAASTAASPPWAQRVEPAPRTSLVTTSTRMPGRGRGERGGEPGRAGADARRRRRRAPTSASGRRSGDDGARSAGRPPPVTRRSVTGCRSRSSARPTAGRARRSRGRRCTSSVPSRSERSSFSGVIIFMYLHDGRGLTGTKSVVGLALRSWCSMPVSVATSTLLARPVVARAGVDHAAGREDLGALGRHHALADQVQRGRRAAALGVHEQLGVGLGGDLGAPGRRR